MSVTRLMIEKLESEDLDLVAGRRANRQDGMVLRKLTSKIANYLIRKSTKVSVRDYGCTLKLFKTDLAKRLDLYGELHRFIPILAHINGAKIAEVDVKHHKRKFGVSKYGLGNRLWVGIVDVIGVRWLLKRRFKLNAVERSVLTRNR